MVDTNKIGNTDLVHVDRGRSATLDVTTKQRVHQTVDILGQLSVDDGPIAAKDGQPYISLDKPCILNIDRKIKVGSSLTLVGWTINAKTIRFCSENEVLPPKSMCWYQRPDVAEGFDIPEKDARGFIAIWDIVSFNMLEASLEFEDASVSKVLIDAISEADTSSVLESARENRARLGIFLSVLSREKLWVSMIIKVLKETNLSYPNMNCAGHIESARGVPGVGGLVVGWSIASPTSDILLSTSEGTSTSLSDAARWNRKDVIDLHSVRHGRSTINSGFIQRLDDVNDDADIYLIGLEGAHAALLSMKSWDLIADDPVAFARWSFDYKTPGRAFNIRLRSHDGPIISRLLNKVSLRRRDFPRELHSMNFGDQPQAPAVTLAIPLYGRYDFVSNQMLEFASDSFMKKKTEIVYIIDDPGIIDSVVSSAASLYEMFQVPFRVVWNCENGGFAVATNLAARQGSAASILMMNSDVIPTQAGWLEEMLGCLENNREVGIVGARLLHPTGAIQHDGMEARWEQDWNAYLNKHPKAGYAPSPPLLNSAPKRTMVTAACLLVRRTTFEEVGGLSEEFLIGDFEDSDFCLRVRGLSLDIRCLQTSSLIHLERQSFSDIGSGGFRESVARFNAIIHQERWSAILDEIYAEGSSQ